MGQVLWQIITMIAKANPNIGPIVMAKWDIKDRFWRLTVSTEDMWHFCYVLPHIHESNPINLAVSTCLQMGWTESPLFLHHLQDDPQHWPREPQQQTHLATPQAQTHVHPRTYHIDNHQQSDSQTTHQTAGSLCQQLHGLYASPNGSTANSLYPCHPSWHPLSVPTPGPQ